MTDTSHVGMGYSICPICGVEHDEVVLLHRFLKPVVPQRSYMGMDLCAEHKAMVPEYLALVECDNVPATGATLSSEDANRTGVICHIRRTVAKQIFNVDLPADIPMVFVEVGVIAKIQERA